MNSLKVIGKYLDQPKLVNKFSKTVPAILVCGSALYGFNHIQNTPENQKKKEAIRTISVLTATVISALIAPGITHKIIKEHHHHHDHGEISKLIDDFLKNNKVTAKTNEILSKAKEKILNPKEIKTVFEELEKKPGAKEFLSGEEGLIPDPENIDSKHIFSEIGKLSILGAIPVIGGIAGGIAGDKLTEKSWKDKIPSKIKEGSYQYLANIFLCNIGAGTALALMEKANVKSKTARALGMVAGIILTGVVLGSAVANLIGKKFIDPILAHKHSHGGLYSERKPEALDIGLHIDDIATVAVLSGLKWIEPALPILYSVSGYRAGIGYRNNISEKK